MFWDPNIKLLLVLGMGFGLALLRAGSDRSFTGPDGRAIVTQLTKGLNESPRIEVPVPLPPHSRF